MSKAVAERALIEMIQSMCHSENECIVGIGDDCAVVPFGGAEDLVLTSDPVIEGVHFTPGTAPEKIGHKAVGRVLSDLGAMGACPKWLLVNLVAGKADEETIRRIYKGMTDLARYFGATVVGGDVAQGEKLHLHVFAAGLCPAGQAVTRRGATQGDVIYVTGSLGGSAQGHHLEFIPRVTEGCWLREQGWATAMIDLSDGLGSDLRRILEQSGVGAEIETDRLPASALIKNADQKVQHMLTDGEDFELLFTVKSDATDDFEAAWQNAFDLPCTRIGRITSSKGRFVLVDSSGEQAEWTGSGFEHFTG